MKTSVRRAAGLVAAAALAVSTLAVGAMREHPRAGNELGRGAIEEPANPGVSRSTDVLGPADASSLPANIAGTAARTPASSFASSATTGTTVSCIDLRSGVPFEYFAQRLLAEGQLDTTWSGNTDRLCLGTTDDLHQIVCSDGAGGVYAGWVDARRGDTDIYLQHFTASGAIAEGWPADGMPVCKAAWSQYNLDLAPDGTGGAFLVWQDFRDRGAGDIYAQHVMGSGALVEGWADGGQPICAEAHAQAYPRAAADGHGGAYVVWEDDRGSQRRLYAQHVTGSGAPLTGWPGEGAPLTAEAGSQRLPSIASDSSGQATIAYREDGSAGCAVQALRLHGADAPTVAWPLSALTLTSGAADLSDIAVVPDAHRGQLVGWVEHREGTATMRLQRLGANGAIDATWPATGVLVCTSELGASAPRLIVAPDSSTIVAWEDFRSGSCDIYAQRLTSNGAISSGWPEGGVAVRVGVGEQYAPSLVADGSGGAFVTWADASTSVQAGFMGAQAVLATQIRLLRTSTSPGRARLVWTVPRGVSGLEVQRRLVDDGEWLPVGVPVPGDSNQMVIEDRSAPEGATLEYRLTLTGKDFVQFLPAIRLSIPVAPLRLALHRAWAIAPQNVIALSLALPRGAPPAADLLDVMGRRVQRHSFPGLEPGEQIVRMDISSRLASGVYFIRLTQGSEARTAKVVLIR